MSQADVTTLCKKTSWTERKIQVWFRRRRNQERAGLRKRFSEARCDVGSQTDVGIRLWNPQLCLKRACVSFNSWRCVFYSFAFVYGVVALHDVSMTENVLCYSCPVVALSLFQMWANLLTGFENLTVVAVNVNKAYAEKHCRLSNRMSVFEAPWCQAVLLNDSKHRVKKLNGPHMDPWP